MDHDRKGKCMKMKQYEMRFYMNFDGKKHSGAITRQTVEAKSPVEAQKKLLAMYNDTIKISSWKELR